MQLSPNYFGHLFTFHVLMMSEKLARDKKTVTVSAWDCVGDMNIVNCTVAVVQTKLGNSR